MPAIPELPDVGGGAPEQSGLVDRDTPSAPTASVPTELEPIRQWTDDTGKYHAIAQLLNADAGSVKLMRDDGFLVTVPLTRLSQPDRKYVEEYFTKSNASAIVMAGVTR